MRFGFLRPGSMVRAIANELVLALGEAAGAERGRRRTGELQ